MLWYRHALPVGPRVPVTAKLSKKFYDVLGEDVANELVDWFNQVDATYRADLRELNELNFQRFEAKLQQGLAELRTEFHRELGAAKSDLIKSYLYFWTPVVLGVIGLYFKK